jgi:hypothetical protein
MKGDDPDHTPDNLVVVFYRGKPEEEAHICSMDRVTEWLVENVTPSDKQMRWGSEHGTISLAGGGRRRGGSLTLQRKGGEGKHADGSSKGNPGGIQCKFGISKGGKLIKLFRKLY